MSKKKKKPDLSEQAIAAIDQAIKELAGDSENPWAEQKLKLQCGLNDDSYHIGTFHVQRTQNYKLEVSATLVQNYPFFQLEWTIGTKNNFRKEESQDVQRWKDYLAGQLCDAMASMEKRVKGFQIGGKDSLPIGIRLFEDDKASPDAAYTCNQLKKELETYCRSAISEQLADNSALSQTAEKIQNVIPLEHHDIGVPEVSLQFIRASEAKSYYVRQTLYFDFAVSVKDTTTDEVKTETTTVALEKDCFGSIPTDLGFAAAYIGKLAAEPLREIADKLRSVIPEYQSKSVPSTKLVFPKELNLEGTKLPNVEIALPILSDTSKEPQKFKTGKYYYGINSGNELCLYRGQPSEPSSIMCFRYPEPVDYNPKMFMPAYQDELPMFAEYFQKAYESFVEHNKRMALPQMKFQLKLVNLMGNYGRLRVGASQKGAPATLEVLVFDQAEKRYVRIDAIHYLCDRESPDGKGTPAKIISKLLEAAYEDEINAYIGKGYAEAFEKFFNSLNYAEKLVLLYYVAESSKHSITHAVQDINDSQGDAKLSDESIRNAVLSLYHRSLVISGKTIPILIKENYEWKHGYFDAYGFYRFPKATLPTLHKPELTVLDFELLTGEGRERMTYRFAETATTSEDRWGVLNELMSCGNNARIQRFAKSDKGKAILMKLKDEERSFAGMLLESVPGMKKIASELLN